MKLNKRHWIIRIFHILIEHWNSADVCNGTESEMTMPCFFPQWTKHKIMHSNKRHLRIAATYDVVYMKWTFIVFLNITSFIIFILMYFTVVHCLLWVYLAAEYMAVISSLLHIYEHYYTHGKKMSSCKTHSTATLISRKMLVSVDYL